MTPSADETLLPVLRAALDQTRSAACITTAELDLPGPEIVYVNPAYCTMTGRRADEVIGATPRIMQGPLTSRAVLDRLRADLEAGRPFVGETVNYHRDGRPFLISWRIDPVVDTDGTTTHYIATQEDITERRRAERLLAAELAIDRSIAGLLSRPADTEANLGTLADDIADAIGGLVDHGRVIVGGSIRLGTALTSFQAGAAADRYQRQLTRSARLGTAASDTGTTGDRWWVGCSLTSERTGTDGAVLVADLERAELDFIDRAGVERAAMCASRALDSLAEYERQRLVAVELQRTLLPGTPPPVSGLDICARYEPAAFAARIGGDWFDVLDHDDRVVLVVGDMAGSGIRAAADMGRLRLLMRVLVQQGTPIPDVFATLNGFCSDEDLFATTLAVIVEHRSGRASIASAGHLPPIVRTGSGTAIAAVVPGPALGIGGSPPYREQPLSVEPGAVVVMFTDGLIEDANELIDASLERLAGEVAADRGEPGALCERLVGRRLVTNPNDDIAVLVARVAERRRDDQPDA